MEAETDQGLITVTTRLRAALDGALGKLRAADAIRLAGFEQRTQLRALLVARAMRGLGWDHGRYRFNGTLESAYARGSSLDREVILNVERGDEGQLVIRAKAP